MDQKTQNTVTAAREKRWDADYRGGAGGESEMLSGCVHIVLYSSLKYEFSLLIMKIYINVSLENFSLDQDILLQLTFFFIISFNGPTRIRERF